MIKNGHWCNWGGRGLPVDDMDWFASDARSCERLAGCASTGIQIFNSIAATAGRATISTQFQTTATTLLIIFLQTGKYSITKPSLNPPCFVHNAHVFVRHILIQNLLVAVQCLDMKCSVPLSECKIWFVPTGIEPSNFLSMPWLSSQHAAWPLLPTQDFSNVLNESVYSKPKWITPEWFHFICFFSSPLHPPTLSSFSESSSSPLFVHQLSWIEFYLFNWARDSSTFLVFPVLPALPSNCPIGAMMESCHHKLLAIVLLCGEWWRSEQRQFCWIESKFSPCAHSDPPSTRYFVTSSSS